MISKFKKTAVYAVMAGFFMFFIPTSIMAVPYHDTKRWQVTNQPLVISVHNKTGLKSITVTMKGRLCKMTMHPDKKYICRNVSFMKNGNKKGFSSFTKRFKRTPYETMDIYALHVTGIPGMGPQNLVGKLQGTDHKYDIVIFRDKDDGQYKIDVDSQVNSQ